MDFKEAAVWSEQTAHPCPCRGQHGTGARTSRCAFALPQGQKTHHMAQHGGPD